MSAIQQALMMMGAGKGAVVGQQIFYTNGTFIVPEGVTSISVLCIGGGGGSKGGANYGSCGGGGGGLAYRNNIAVTPGQSISCVVGTSPAGGNGTATQFSSSPATIAYGGTAGNYGTGGVQSGGSGGSYSGQGGGTGGTGGGVTISGDVYSGAGGGGTGGYSGSGGAGGANTEYQGNPGGGSATGGGGGGSGQPSNDFDLLNSGGYGGAVSIYGQGAAANGGAAGVYGPNGAGPGGVGGPGMDRGSGAGGMRGSPSQASHNYPGAPGIIRIIWPGNFRQFPSTRTADE